MSDKQSHSKAAQARDREEAEATAAEAVPAATSKHRRAGQFNTPKELQDAQANERKEITAAEVKAAQAAAVEVTPEGLKKLSIEEILECPEGEDVKVHAAKLMRQLRGTQGVSPAHPLYIGK